MQQPNRGALTEADIFTAAGVAVVSVAVVTGQYNKIGEHIISAGIYKSIGFGASNSQSDAVGRLFVKLQTAAPAEIPGKFRISIFSPQDRNMRTVAEFHTSALDQNVTDRTKQLPLPEQLQAIGKDYKFVFEFKPDLAGTITKANSTIIIDMTEQLIN